MVSAIPLQSRRFFFISFLFAPCLSYTHLSAHLFVLSSLCLLFFMDLNHFSYNSKTGEHPMVPPTLFLLHQPIPLTPFLIPLFFLFVQYIVSQPSMQQQMNVSFFQKGYPIPARVCTLQYNLVRPMAHGVAWFF